MQPLLPRLKTGEKNTLSTFKQFGVWDGRPAIEVNNLSNSLLVDQIDPNYFDIDCIPNIWARPILFEMALYDDDHLLHSRILGEWRGFLAMLALREIRNLSSHLTAEIVQLPEDDNARKDAPEFLKAAEKLIPMRLLASDTTWYNLYLILFNNKPIGMTSPTTLVCTASDYRDRITQNDIAWFDGKFLKDPNPYLVEDEKIALKSWLEQLKTNLTIPVDKRVFNPNILDTLLKLIADYQNDLEVALPANPVELGNGMGMTIGIFQYLDRPVKAIGKASNVVISPRQGVSAPSMLVVGRSIADQWGVPRMAVTVWDDITLETFPYDNPRVLADKLPKDFTLRCNVINDFFTDKLYLLELREAFPGARRQYTIEHENSAKTPILPIKSELLNYLSPDELMNRINFEQSPNSIKVSLELPLSGLGNNKNFKITKEYNLQGDDIVSLSNVPVLEVWPNFKREKWSIYYTYFFHQEMSFLAEPFVPKEQPKEQPNELIEKFDIKQKTIFRTKSFPEAMICRSENGDEAGLILLRSPRQIDINAILGWKIGIDFGTTGTIVYGYSNFPFLIEFNDHLFSITNSGVPRSSLYDNFLPSTATEMRTPFLSIYHDFGLVSRKPPLFPLIDGHIYFLSDYKSFDARKGGIITDLKWSRDPNIRIRTQAFLEQLCLQCSAEAAVNGINRIEWFFSYPAAFSMADLNDFRAIWNSITTRCAEATGIEQISPQEERESIAAAHYFANRVNAPLATGTVCIDIGGGTSDICIWQNLNLLWHASLRFAGRNLFLDPLFHKPDFLNIFNVDREVLEPLQSLKDRGDIIAFYAQADALIKEEGQRWLTQLAFHNADQDVQKFKQIIAIGLSGLFYYIGLILRYLKDSGDYQEWIPNIYIGGNGAKMFDWLNSGHFTDKSPIKELFRDVLLKASNFETKDQQFTINISPNPKHESAYGLVDRNLNMQSKVDFLNNNRVIAGEVFNENGQRQEWNEIISADRMSKGLEAETAPSCLIDFLQTFEDYARSPVSMILPINADKALVHSVYQDLANVLANHKGIEPSKIIVEPLFISELKALVKEMINRWE